MMLNLKTEKNIFTRGIKLIGSIDEAGRGPLAGPVVAACVLVSEQALACISRDFDLINDSKKIVEKKREVIAEFVLKNFSVGIGICDNETIDRINILQASLLAMKKAIGALKIKPDYLLVDGNQKIPNISINQATIIKGDSEVFSIAAASIVAKVYRDRLMQEMHKQFPAYEFDKHKGYGTKLHLQKITEYGPCKIHRVSFGPVSDALKK